MREQDKQQRESLKAAIKEKGITVTHIAKVLNLHRSTVSSAINCSERPVSETIITRIETYIRNTKTL